MTSSGNFLTMKITTHRVKDVNMKIKEYFKLRLVTVSCKSALLLFLSIFMSLCVNPNADSGSNLVEYSFSGNWRGNGTDSEGNSFAFFAKVSHLGENKYRMFILNELNSQNKPIHIMDGVLENNTFSYTADEGLYEGGGTLSKDMFEGYYKGPVDGTYTMRRVK